MYGQQSEMAKIFTFSLSNNSLSLSIELSSSSEFVLYDYHIYSQINGAYKYWTTAYEK